MCVCLCLVSVWHRFFFKNLLFVHSDFYFEGNLAKVKGGHVDFIGSRNVKSGVCEGVRMPRN